MRAHVTDVRGRYPNLKTGAPSLKVKLSIVLCMRALESLRFCIMTILDSCQIRPNRTISVKQQARV